MRPSWMLNSFAMRHSAAASKDQVLLEAVAAVVRKVADLLEVRLRLEQRADLEVDAVADLDEGLGFGPAERKQEKGGDEASRSRPQGAVRGNRHESVSPLRPDVSDNAKDNGTSAGVQSLMYLNHSRRL